MSHCQYFGKHRTKHCCCGFAIEIPPSICHNNKTWVFATIWAELTSIGVLYVCVYVYCFIVNEVVLHKNNLYFRLLKKIDKNVLKTVLYKIPILLKYKIYSKLINTDFFNLSTSMFLLTIISVISVPFPVVVDTFKVVTFKFVVLGSST